MNCEIPDVQAGFRKGRGTRDQIANIPWIIKKARVPEKHLFLLIDYAKAFDCVDHNKLWKILREMEIPDHLTCLVRNLYAGQEKQLELDMDHPRAPAPSILYPSSNIDWRFISYMIVYMFQCHSPNQTIFLASQIYS